MKHKLLFIFCTLLFTSCSVTIVYAPKDVCVHGKDNKVAITGSDLKGNSASQKTDGKLTIPLLK